MTAKAMTNTPDELLNELLDRYDEFLISLQSEPVQHGEKTRYWHEMWIERVRDALDNKLAPCPLCGSPAEEQHGPVVEWFRQLECAGPFGSLRDHCDDVISGTGHGCFLEISGRLLAFGHVVFVVWDFRCAVCKPVIFSSKLQHCAARCRVGFLLRNLNHFICAFAPMAARIGGNDVSGGHVVMGMTFWATERMGDPVSYAASPHRVVPTHCNAAAGTTLCFYTVRQVEVSQS
jgi:hypothetical protein